MAVGNSHLFWGLVGTMQSRDDPQGLETQLERNLHRFCRRHRVGLTGVVSFWSSQRRGNPHILYLAGPMTGIPEWNAPAFEAAQVALVAGGWEVITPLELVPIDHPDQIPPWEECLRQDLQAVLLCDGVAVLLGWEQSRGASFEVQVANTVGIPVKTVEEWLRLSPAASQN